MSWGDIVTMYTLCTRALLPKQPNPRPSGVGRHSGQSFLNAADELASLPGMNNE
jgi:hypothetical protein